MKVTTITGPTNLAEVIRRTNAGEIVHWTETTPGRGRMVLIWR
ncbi:hypothetical protein ACFC1B_29600 [Streptomyces xiamenensis]